MSNPSITDIVKANGIELAYEAFGDAGKPPLLLIMGLGVQMIGWDRDFCAQLADEGFYVIRYDNRDVGESTHFSDWPPATTGDLLKKAYLGRDLQSPYTLSDMADDAIGLLDAINIPAAHLVGLSMGGMIAQLVAIHHPSRTLSLTSMMSSTGGQTKQKPSFKAVSRLLRKRPNNRAEYIEARTEGAQFANGTRFEFDEARIRRRAGIAYDRDDDPNGSRRQLAAVVTTKSRRALLGQLRTSTLVIHGSSDLLVPVDNGYDTAQSIPGARLLIIPGMGHYLPDQVWPEIIGAIAAHIKNIHPFSQNNVVPNHVLESVSAEPTSQIQRKLWLGSILVASFSAIYFARKKRNNR